MADIIDGFSSDGVSIGPGVVNSHKITVELGEVYRAIFVMNDNKRQEYSMRFWVSRNPGETPLGPNEATRLLSVGKTASEVYVAEEHANITSLGEIGTSVIDPSLGLKSTHSRGNAPLHEAGPWVLVESIGDFYLNIKNYDGTTNNYKMLSSLESTTDVILPVWVTESGSLGSFNEYSEYSQPLDATNAISYTVISGILPDGVLLVDGVLRGTFSNVPYMTTYNFIVRASNSHGVSDQPFSITVNDYPD